MKISGGQFAFGASILFAIMATIVSLKLIESFVRETARKAAAEEIELRLDDGARRQGTLLADRK